MRVLRAHGLSTTSLQDVYHATLMSKMLYCSPAWSGLCSATDIARLDVFVRRSKKLGYCRPETPAVAELFEKADDDLFERINTNSRHVLYQFLPPKTAHSYNTRPRHHNFSLIEQSTDLNHRDFLYACHINMPNEHSFIDIYSFTLLRHYCLYHFYYVLLSCACQLFINQYLISRMFNGARVIAL